MGSTPSILIIGSNEAPDLLELRRAFSQAGVANPLHFFKSDREAMQYLEEAGVHADRRDPAPGVILVDLDQPGRFDLLTRIRRRFPGGGLLVVALTRLEEIRKISRAYALGANSFLTKPVRVGELQELINMFSGYWLVQRLFVQEQDEFVASERYA